MTHVDMGVKQGAAEFLFVLCKESGEWAIRVTDETYTDEWAALIA